MKFSFAFLAMFFVSSCVAQNWTTIHDFGSQTSQGIMWIDDQTVWACTAIYGGQPLQAKKSIDGGDNWESQNTGLPGGSAGNMRDVASPDSVNIFMIGNEGNLIRNNGGDTWEIVNLGNTLPLRTIQFASAEIGYIGSDEGHFYKSTDGGQTWTDIGLPEAASVNAMYFLTENKGFVYTYGVGIYKTLDGGASFEYITFDQPLSVFSNGIRDMTFVDDNLGFAVGTNEVVMRTTDGGDNWDFIPMGTTNTMQGVDFANASTGFAVGWNATVIGTFDGGETWQVMTTDSPTDTELFHDVDFYGNKGLLTTNSGYVLSFNLDVVLGCTNPQACNYDSQATVDDGSCDFLDSFAIDGPLAVVSLSQESYSYTNTPGSTYFWEVSGGSIGSGQGSSAITVNWGSPGMGTVSVTETNAEGCSGAPVLVEVAIDPTSISDVSSRQVVVYPNPSTGIIRIETDRSWSASTIAEIWSAQGKLIDKLTAAEWENNSVRLDLNHLNSGVYMLLLKADGDIWSSDLILLK